MRWCFIMLMSVVCFACQKSNDVAPANVNQATENQDNDQNGQNGNNSDQLDESVEVTYQLQSQGGNIVDGKYEVGDKDYKLCGEDEFEFTFETQKKLNLRLIGTIKNRSGQKIEAKILVDDRVVAQEILEGDGEKGRFKQVEANYQLKRTPDNFK